MAARRETVVRREGSSAGGLALLIVVLLAIAGAGVAVYLLSRQAPPEEQKVQVEPVPAPVPEPAPAPAPVPAPQVVQAEPAPQPPVAVAEPAPQPPVAVVEPAPQVTEPEPPLPPIDIRKLAEEVLRLPDEPARPAPAPPPEPTIAAVPPMEPAPLPELVAQARQASEPKLAFDLLTKSAAQGDAEGQFDLAQAYRAGRGTRADPVRALAWFMQAAARGHPAAAGERDKLLQTLDDTGKVQADTLTRSLPVPMPAGWLVDSTNGIRVWSPSWYRNGTFKLQIEGAAADGRLHGPGKVTLTATLYGRSDRSFEGEFTHGMLLDKKLREAPELSFDLAESDEVRMVMPPRGAVLQLWRQTKLDSMQIEACPSGTLRLYAVMAPDFNAIEDAAVKAVAVEAMQSLAAICPPKPHTPAWVTLLPPEAQPRYDRGSTGYSPQLAEVQLYGMEQPLERWSISIKNQAREAHAQREHAAEEQRKRDERAQKEARNTAAAMARSMPDIRGFKLGIGFDAFKAALGAEAVTWAPKLKDDFKLPEHSSHEQKVTLSDGTSFTGLFASTQNGSQLMSLVYEQHLRDGPALDAMRRQLSAKYGEPDEDTGNGTWLTWWLRSSVGGEPKGAMLRARMETDRDRRVATLRLIVSDYTLARRDEAQAAEARRQVEREAFEKKKSDKPRF